MAGILGFGAYIPDRVMTNDEWAERVDTSDEWITQRTGIKTRRWAAPEETTVDLAEAASRVAIKDAGLGMDEIDEIVLATDTREVVTPDTASFLQHRLGLREVPAYDLGGSGCAGFVQALDVARGRILLEPKNVLVIGVELITKLISLQDRATAVLFGDGAGAVVVGPAPGRAQVLGAVAGTDGSKTDILTLETGGSRRPFSIEEAERGAHKHLVMKGPEVFREAVRRMPEAAAQVLAKIGKRTEDVDLVIPHQANWRIIDAVRRKMGLAEEAVYVNVDRLGNTGSASVPIALWEAESTGVIKPGDLVVLTAFGAGFHWAAAALQF